MILGMDFGTTNTSAALFDGGEVRLLPVDPHNPSPVISRTAVYLTRTGDIHLGSAALNLYFEQNVGRPTRYKKTWVGEILQVFAELPAFYRDVYVYEDEFSPGRLFLSIKTVLRNAAYEGTVFLDRWYSASDLAAVFLMGVKRNIEENLGREVDQVVLGRPVHFSMDEQEDTIAQSRLLDAAFKAGFKEVYLEYEPVAAALSYERRLEDKETILVFDFGGGTLDFTVMEVGDPRARRVLATGGIPIGGDIFDQRLFRTAIPRHLGEGDYFISNGRQYPVPSHIFDLLTTPQEVVALNTPQNQEMLRAIHAGAIHKNKTQALLELVSSNYSLLMFDLVEKAKRRLSDQTDTHLSLVAPTFSIEETITRKRFERAIQRDYDAIIASMQETLDRAGVSQDDIRRVIRTGGSSQIPMFTRMLNRTFGYDKVEGIDVFSSVTSGLSILGHEIASGLTDLHCYTPESFPRTEAIAAGRSRNTEIQEVDLSDVEQRLKAARDFQEGAAALPEEILLVASPAGLAALDPGERRSIPEEQVALLEKPLRLLRMRADSQVLFATNSFKLIAAQATAIFRAGQIGPEALREMLRLEPGDEITAAAIWQPEHPHLRFLTLVTRFGQARSFESRLIAGQVLKRPYFELERRYASFPGFLVPQDEQSRLVAGTSSGRLVQARPKEMAIFVSDLLKLRQGEEIAATVTAGEDQILLAVSASGEVQSFEVSALPLSLKRSFAIAGLVASGDRLLCLTSRGRLLPADLPEQLLDAPGGPLPCLKLEKGEEVLAVV